MGPVLCLITDRRRMSPPSEDALVEAVRSAAMAGVHLVQVRERDLEGRLLFHLVRRLMGAVAGTAARILVNDRLDVALAAGAHGVHLRGDSMAASRVRALARPPFLVGRSVHGVDETKAIVEDGGVDFLLFGPVFPTASKPGAAGAGLDALRRVVEVSPVPVLAVGGLTLDRIKEVAGAGAAGVAGISLFAASSPLDLQIAASGAALSFDRRDGVS